MEVNKMDNKQLTDHELEKVSGGPEERTVLGQKAAVDCRKCENCGKLFEDDALAFCTDCGGRIK